MRKYWCPVCEKPIPAAQLIVNTGDKVNFTMQRIKMTRSGIRVCCSNKVGKITDIKNDIADVTYRGRVYQMNISRLSPADAPGSLSRLISGECECSPQPEGAADD
ncbi:hypothetical protein [Morganella morganii]|uniref:hypothetical protein n=1 Tax=Morganella morganii TaxID=582 RepID=UPI0033152AD7